MKLRPSVSFFDLEHDMAFWTTSSVSLSEGNLYPKMGHIILFVLLILPPFVGNKQ